MKSISINEMKKKKILSKYKLTIENNFLNAILEISKGGMTDE